MSDAIDQIRKRHAINDCRTYTVIHEEHRQCHEDCRTLLRRIDELTDERDKLQALSASETRRYLTETIEMQKRFEDHYKPLLAAANQRAEDAAQRERERCVKAVEILCDEYVSTYEGQEADAVEQYEDFADMLIQIMRTGTCESGATDYEKKIADALSRNEPQEPQSGETKAPDA